MDTAIRKAHERTTFVSQDEIAYRAYEDREKALHDWNSGVNYALREQNKEIARKMKAKNMPMDEIVELTGLNENQINDL